MQAKVKKVRAIELFRDSRFKSKTVESKKNYKRNNKHKKQSSQDSASFL